jgi:hypothetical protein
MDVNPNSEIDDEVVDPMPTDDNSSENEVMEAQKISGTISENESTKEQDRLSPYLRYGKQLSNERSVRSDSVLTASPHQSRFSSLFSIRRHSHEPSRFRRCSEF